MNSDENSETIESISYLFPLNLHLALKSNNLKGLPCVLIKWNKV